MAAALGQPIVVDNQVGASGLIGINQILHSPADGHTIGMVSATYVIVPSLHKLPYDAGKDILPISILTSGPLVLALNPKLPAQNFAEFMALAKARPADSSLTLGHPGVGTTVHLASEFLAASSGARFLSVPYKGNSTYTTDLLAGQLDAAFLPPAIGLPFIKAGKVRAIGISTRTRLPLLPDVPTISESGLPNFDVDGWLALIARNGTPKAVIRRLNAEVVRVLKTEEFGKYVRESGGVVVGSTAEEAADVFARDLDRYAKLIRTMDIKRE
jgi:tripartite-type tricarboxylate transporter receptor subunit TctC